MFHVKHFVHTKMFHKNVYNVSRETIVSKNRSNFLFCGKKVLFFMFAMFHVKHLHQKCETKLFYRPVSDVSRETSDTLSVKGCF